MTLLTTNTPNANSKIVNKYNKMSFSNYIEGFAVDDNDECDMIYGKEKYNYFVGKNPHLFKDICIIC